MGLGLAIAVDAVRACEASRAWRGLRLRWCGAARLPAGLISASSCEENIASVARFRRHLAVVFRGLWVRPRPRVGLPDTSVRVRLLFADALPEDPAEQRRYLLWRLADVLDLRPERSRLAYMALPSPLPGPRHAVLCAVAGENVVHQYERALAESRVRYAGIAPSSVLRFNLFQRRLTGPPGAPVLLLAAGEATVATILTLGGCPILWRTRAPAGTPEFGVQAQPSCGRTRALAGTPEGGEAEDGDGWDGVLRDVTEAIAYGEDRLGVNPPARILLTGTLAGQPGLATWLRVQVRIPTYYLDARRLLQRVPDRLAAEGWTRWGAALGAAARE